MGAFSVFKDRKTKKTSGETPTAESHYIRLARASAFLRYLCMVLVVVFSVYSFSFHSDEITIDNFRYMLKFINLGEEAETPEGSVLTFDSDSTNRGLIFKGDLCVINESGVTVTGWDGDTLVKESFGYDHPKTVENGTNLFCFDLGGSELRIFTSYSQVSLQSFSYPIYAVAASKSGSYAVVSSEKGYRSAVFVYDQHFREIYHYYFGKLYTDFVDISPSGNEIITLSHYSADGNLVSSLSRYSTTDSSAEPYTAEFAGEIPLGVYYTDYGYALLTGSALRMFSSDGTQLGEVSFAGKELLSAHIYGKYSAITYGTEGLSGGNEVFVCGSDGSEITTERFSGTLSDIMIYGETMWTISPGAFVSIDLGKAAENKVYTVPTSFNRILSDEGRPILFSENEAHYFSEAEYGNGGTQ